jgi:hypothetical protein
VNFLTPVGSVGRYPKRVFGQLVTIAKSLKGINNLGVLRNLRGSSTSKAKTSRRLFLWETMRSNVGNRRTL